jgi:hypothetical protein
LRRAKTPGSRIPEREQETGEFPANRIPELTGEMPDASHFVCRKLLKLVQPSQIHLLNA